MTPLLASAPVAFIYVTDRERALTYYVDVLGLTLRSSDPGGDFIDIGGGALVRMTAIPGHEPGPHPVLGWNVDDIEAAVGALLDRGANFIIEGEEDDLGIWTSPDGTIRVAFFTDPDGNVLTLSQA